MKIKQDDEKFQPVHITLESKKEVMILRAALSRVSGGGVDDDILYKIYKELGTAIDDAVDQYRTKPSINSGSLEIVEV